MSGRRGPQREAGKRKAPCRRRQGQNRGRACSEGEEVKQLGSEPAWPGLLTTRSILVIKYYLGQFRLL